LTNLRKSNIILISNLDILKSNLKGMNIMGFEKVHKIEEYLNQIELHEIKDVYRKIEQRYKALIQQAGLQNVKCFTGDNEDFLTELRRAIKRAVEINFIVSFLLESGVRLIIEDLIEAKKRGSKIRIVTGRYLNITQPSALYLIRQALGNYVDLRFYKFEEKSFHPKAYIFEYENDDGEVFIGSSNISEQALCGGIEWNYKIEKKTNYDDFLFFKNEFLNIFHNQSIDRGN
jgi:HKD family nuclease